MPQSLAEVYFHIVFSTKDRVPFLKDRTLRKEMHAYLAGACRNLGSPSLITGGVEDHVHILCRFGKTVTIADLIKGLKTESSKWIKGKDRSLSVFIGKKRRLPRAALRLPWASGYNPFGVQDQSHGADRR